MQSARTARCWTQRLRCTSPRQWGAASIMTRHAGGDPWNVRVLVRCLVPTRVSTGSVPPAASGVKVVRPWGRSTLTPLTAGRNQHAGPPSEGSTGQRPALGTGRDTRIRPWGAATQRVVRPPRRWQLEFQKNNPRDNLADNLGDNHRGSCSAHGESKPMPPSRTHACRAESALPNRRLHAARHARPARDHEGGPARVPRQVRARGGSRRPALPRGPPSAGGGRQEGVLQPTGAQIGSGSAGALGMTLSRPEGPTRARLPQRR